MILFRSGEKNSKHSLLSIDLAIQFDGLLQRWKISIENQENRKYKNTNYAIKPFWFSIDRHKLHNQR